MAKTSWRHEAPMVHPLTSLSVCHAQEYELPECFNASMNGGEKRPSVLWWE